MIEMLLGWIDRYPIASIEDPLAEDDREGWVAFTRAAGSRIQIIGDDYLTTNDARVREAANDRACNAVLIKPNQAGTVTERLAALSAGRAAGFGTIVAAFETLFRHPNTTPLDVGWVARYSARRSTELRRTCARRFCRSEKVRVACAVAATDRS